MGSCSSPASSRKRPTHEKANEYAETTIKIINSHIKHIEGINDKEEIDLIAVKIIQACERCKYQEFKEFLFTMVGVVEQFLIGEKDIDEVKETFQDAKEVLKYMNPVVRHTQVKKRRHIKHSVFKPEILSGDKALSAFHTFYITFTRQGMPGDLEWAWSNLKKVIEDKNLSGLVSEIDDYLFQYTEREKAYALVEELGEKLKNPEYQTIGDIKRMVKKQCPGGNDYSWSIALLAQLRKREKCFLMKSNDYYFVYAPNYGNIQMIEGDCSNSEVIDENREDIKAVKEMLDKNLWAPPVTEKV